MRALYVPADPSEPVHMIDLDRDGDRLRTLQQAVGGLVGVQGHDTHDFWMDDEGLLTGQPLNDRVSHWVLNDSEPAKTGQIRGMEEYWIIHGDVVVTGPPDRNGDITPVPQDMVDTFSRMEISKEAMRDWDTHDVPPAIITDWPEASIEPPDHGMDL